MSASPTKNIKMLYILVFYFLSNLFAQTCPGGLPPESFGLNCDLYSIHHGCLYVPQQRTSGNDTLLLFIRGNYQGRGDVPSDRSQDSIDRLLNVFALNQQSEDMKIPIYMTTSSNMVFDVDQVYHLAHELSLKKPVKIIIAAHSGGYRGLYYTLQNLMALNHDFKVQKIVMLDNFYMDIDWVDIFSDYVNSGTECTGFVTQHNLLRLNSRFLPRVKCQVEGPRGHDHNSSVKRCLKGYVLTDKCQ